MIYEELRIVSGSISILSSGVPYVAQTVTRTLPPTTRTEGKYVIMLVL